MDRKPRDHPQAVALRHAAKGRGYLAKRILEIARAHNVPVREDKNLVQVLSRLDLNKEIPPEVYRAVAEILTFVYQLTRRYQQGQETGRY
jgi:flagellar biosynthesis protein